MVPVIIVPYYCVIGGWVLKYLVSYMNGMGATGALTGDFFATFISGSWEPLIYFFIFAAMAFVVVVLGVQKGIEKVSKILMPILAILAVVLAVFVLCQRNAWKGLSYIFVPDFDKFSGEMLLDALGQLFYSMSLAMCIMITYGSYMKKDANIQKSGRQISVCDTSFAIVASLIIIPAIFAFSANPDGDLASSGPSLMFVVLPNVFGAFPFGAVGRAHVRHIAVRGDRRGIVPTFQTQTIGFLFYRFRRDRGAGYFVFARVRRLERHTTER